MAKKPGPLVDENAATLQLIQLLLTLPRNKNSFSPVTIQSIRKTRALLKIITLKTNEKTENFPKGKIYWQFPPDLELNLKNIGIDPATHALTDKSKFQNAIKAFEQNFANHLNDKFFEANANQRKQSIKNSLNNFYNHPNTTTTNPSNFLKNHAINQKIAKHLRKVIEI